MAAMFAWSGDCLLDVDGSGYFPGRKLGTFQLEKEDSTPLSVPVGGTLPEESLMIAWND
jgi:hypothetical protein